MGLVFFLVSANETAGSSGAASPAAASVRAWRRDTPVSDARDRLEWRAFGAVRSTFIVGLLVGGGGPRRGCFSIALAPVRMTPEVGCAERERERGQLQGVAE